MFQFNYLKTMVRKSNALELRLLSPDLSFPPPFLSESHSGLKLLEGLENKNASVKYVHVYGAAKEGRGRRENTPGSFVCFRAVRDLSY